MHSVTRYLDMPSIEKVMGFIKRRRRVGMLVVWPSRTPSTRRDAFARDSNGRSGGVVERARAMPTRRVDRAFEFASSARARDRAVLRTARPIARRRRGTRAVGSSSEK